MLHQNPRKACDKREKSHSKGRHTYHGECEDAPRRKEYDSASGSTQRHSSSQAFESTRADGTRADRYSSHLFKRPEVDDAPVYKLLSDKQHSQTLQPSSKPKWMKGEFYKSDSGKLDKSEQKKVTQQTCAAAEAAESNSALAPLSRNEINQLGAKLIKAEMLGNAELVEKLKKQLDTARQASETNIIPENLPKATEDVILTRSNIQGFCLPLQRPDHGMEGPPSQKKQKQGRSHDVKRNNSDRFCLDDKYSLKNMFEREKFSSAEESNKLFAQLAGQAARTPDEEYDLGDAITQKVSEAESQEKIRAEDRLKAIQEHKHKTAALEACHFCLESQKMQKHLIIAIGIKVYICLPKYKPLTEGHCLIVPMSHVAAATHVDEDVWAEIQIFRKGLTRMFLDDEQDVVYLESSRKLHRFPHMSVECIPVPKEIGEMAPFYFKKAILECETEWSHNKKLVDLSSKNIRKSVPKGLPYFSVDFGLQGGFAHVIEDERLFPSYFGREVIGGMLDLEPQCWRKPQWENFDSQRQRVLRFAEMWKPYDWTQRLKETEEDTS